MPTSLALAGRPLDTLSQAFLDEALGLIEREAHRRRDETRAGPVDVDKVLELLGAALAGGLQGKVSPESLERILVPLGEYCLAHSRATEAVEAYEQLVALRRAGAPGGRELADALTRLGSAYRLAGRDAEAEPVLLEALPILEAQGPDGREGLSRLFGNLALVFAASGRGAQAEALASRAVATVSAIAAAKGRPAVDAVVAAFESQARVFLRQGDAPAAEAALRRALVSLEWDRRDEAMAGSLASLSRVLQVQGKPAAAALLEARALELLQGKAATPDASAAVRLDRQAELLVASGLGGEPGRSPEELRSQAAALRAAQLARPDPEVAEVLERWGRFCRGLGQLPEAARAYRQAVAILAQAGPAHAGSVARAQAVLQALGEAP